MMTESDENKKSEHVEQVILNSHTESSSMIID